jgi:phosphoribosylformylglycinamidine synthase
MPDLDDFSRFMAEVRDAGIFAPWIGTTGGNTLTLGNARPISVKDLQAAHEGWFPAYMAGEL